MPTRARPSRSSFCSSGVSRLPASSIMTPIWPTSVRMPVAVTSSRPRPSVTVVPMKAMQDRSPSGASGSGTGSGLLLTACDSPVRAASSTCSRTASMMRPSAGTRMPAERITRSPGTSSAAGIWRSTPSRTTWADRHGLLLEGGEGLLGLPLGQEADGGVQHDDDQDGDRLDVLPEREGDDRGREQQEDDQVLELRTEDRERRATAELGEAIRPELREPSGSLGLGQSACGIAPESLRSLGDGERVPGRRSRMTSLDRQPSGPAPARVDSGCSSRLHREDAAHTSTSFLDGLTRSVDETFLPGIGR